MSAGVGLQRITYAGCEYGCNSESVWFVHLCPRRLRRRGLSQCGQRVDSVQVRQGRKSRVGRRWRVWLCWVSNTGRFGDTSNAELTLATTEDAGEGDVP